MRSQTIYNELFSYNVTSYGSHAYIVFRNAYDRYIRFLDNFRVADSWQYTKENVLPKRNFFITRKNIFIQFCEKKSMNGHCGYIWRLHKGGVKTRDDEMFAQGYKPIEEIIEHEKTTGFDETTYPPAKRGVPSSSYMWRLFQYG